MRGDVEAAVRGVRRCGPARKVAGVEARSVDTVGRGSAGVPPGQAIMTVEAQSAATAKVAVPELSCSRSSRAGIERW